MKPKKHEDTEEDLKTVKTAAPRMTRKSTPSTPNTSATSGSPSRTTDIPIGNECTNGVFNGMADVLQRSERKPFVAKKKTKPKKRKDPSPFKEYAAFDSGVWIPFVRVGYFDDWNQRYVIEGRVRKDNDAKRVSKKWATVGHLSGNLMVFEPLDPKRPWTYTYPTCLASDGVFRDEIERYAARAREWFKTGNPLRDLHLQMARENGTLPKDDTPLGEEEMKHD